MATEKLNPAKLPKDIDNIERALLSDSTALPLFTDATGQVNVSTSLSDGKGLTLIRRESGSWIWYYRYRIHNKPSRLSLGEYPAVTLAQARQKHSEAYTLVKQGIDPAQARQESKAQAKTEAQNTFEQVARLWWDNWRIGKGITDKHATSTWRRLENDVLPKLGKRSINALVLREIAPVLKAIEERAQC